MSITKNDEKQLRGWFLELNRCVEKGQDLRQSLISYYEYREKIAHLILTRLDDLFQIKKADWKNRNKISEDDAISIIHDSILVSLDKFKLTANVKFITFFWRVLHNTLFNFISKYKKLKPYSSRFIPDPLLHSLDYLQLAKDWNTRYVYKNPKSRLTRSMIDYLVSIERNDESKSDYKLLLEYMINRLSEQQRFILQSILQGYTLEEIAKDLKVSDQTVRIRLKKIRAKFSDMEEQLCPTRKQ